MEICKSIHLLSEEAFIFLLLGDAHVISKREGELD